MALFRLASLLSCSLMIPASLAAQPPQHDPQAVAVLQRSVATMGGGVPTDSVATGGVVLVAGSKTDTGTIRILTRGSDQSAEQINTSGGLRAVIYSRGRAKETQGTSAKGLQLELAVTSQSPGFPLPLLTAILGNADAAYQYVGLETLAGVAVHHIRVWNTFMSSPELQQLVEFSTKDIWVDATSGLPCKLSYHRRAGGGPEPRIPVEVFYSDYRNVGGVMYPFHVEKSLNGTPWATIGIQSVALNTGLTDADFPIR